jgi:hypothetical protein
MPWIIATTLDKKHANLHSNQIAAILDRVPGSPQEGSEVLFAGGVRLEVTESPAELIRAIENEERPEDASPLPTEAW